MQEIVKKAHDEKALKRMLLWAIMKSKEGKPEAAVADQRLPRAQTFIADIAAEVENDRRNPR